MMENQRKKNMEKNIKRIKMNIFQLQNYKTLNQTLHI
jgi:hypothetical protein